MTSNLNKIELLSKRKDSNRYVISWFTGISRDQFFRREGEAWSASDNLDHLIKSHKPIAKALRLPKFTLKAMFGSADQPSRGYEAICQVYRDKLAAGGVASGRFLPDPQTPDDLETAKNDLLNDFPMPAVTLYLSAKNGRKKI